MGSRHEGVKEVGVGGVPKSVERGQRLGSPNPEGLDHTHPFTQRRCGLRRLLPVQLRDLDPADPQVGVQKSGGGIDEQPHRGHEGRQRFKDGGGHFGSDEAWCARNEDESQRVGSGVDGHEGVFEARDATDFDPNGHPGTMIGTVAFLQCTNPYCAHPMNASSRRQFIVEAASLMLAPTLLGAGPSKAGGTIGISVLTLTNPFFRDLADAMTAEAKKHGLDTLVTSGEFDAARQRNQVADFIVRKTVAMILCPCDSKAVGTALLEANKAGIPVFTADIASLAKEGKVVGHVATDNFGGGRFAAIALIEALGGKGKVAILDHPEVESVILRTRGFLQELEQQKKDKGVTIQVVATLPGGAAKDRSMKATEDLLQSHPDLNGIFAINDPSALGAVAALEKAGRLAQIKVVGFDGMPEGKSAIKAGKIYADPIQFPDRIGQAAVQNVIKYLAGDDVQRETLIPTALYRQADAAKDPAVK